MYKKDHMDVLRFLSADLPKRTPRSTKEIAVGGFKRRDNADRIVRNAYRMLRDQEHIEICDRGVYRLTTKGAAFSKKAAENGYKVVAKPKAEKNVPKGKKATAAKATVAKAKPASKPASKAAKKAAPKKAATKKAAPVARVAGATRRSRIVKKEVVAPETQAVEAKPEKVVKKAHRPGRSRIPANLNGASEKSETSEEAAPKKANGASETLSFA